MDWKPQNWNTVLTALARGKRVIPVIGEALQTVPNEQGESVPFVKLLARQLMESLPASDQVKVLEYLKRKHDGRPAEPSLHDLALLSDFRSQRGKFADALSPLHDALLDEAMAHIFPAIEPTVEQRHPLRLLAEIRSFPLYLTTTPDSLMKRVLARVRGLRDDDVRGFQLIRNTPERATTADKRADYSWDLPPSWEPSATARPFLFHLFGRIDDPDGGARFDVTEEDHFEMLCRLQSESWCPQQLIWELKPAHILLLGQWLADWHARFFVRLLRGQRLSAPEEPTTEALVDSLYQPGPEPPHYTSLAVFLDTFSEDTRIYRDGDPEQFVRQLYGKWSATQKVDEIGGIVAAADLGASSPDLNYDGVFISYCWNDRVAANRLAAGIRAAGIKVYLDKARAVSGTGPGLAHGSDHEIKLRQNINQALFFIPLLSANTEKALSKGSYYRKEWYWAIEKRKAFSGAADREFVRPVIVDGSSVSALPNIQPEFRESCHILPLADGECTEPFLTELLAAMEKWRGR